MRKYLQFGALAVILSVNLSVVHAEPEPFGKPAFERVWQRTDLPVQTGSATSSWVWGPAPFTPLLNEALSEAENGRRAVQYFDKGRMEINDPSADPTAPWYVSNGLLVRELIQGQIQVGNSIQSDPFIPLGAAHIPIAGVPDT